MLKLEDLQPDATVRGILPDAAVTVVSVAWHGSDALTLVYRGPNGRVAGGRGDTLVRIACQELEAWYFGAPQALANAFDRPELSRLADKARFRDPDAIVQPARALAEHVEEFQKISGARRLAQVLTKENRSRSFQVLIAGIEGLAPQMCSTSMPRGAH